MNEKIVYFFCSKKRSLSCIWLDCHQAGSSTDEDLLACWRDNEHLLVVLDRDLSPFDELQDFLDEFRRLIFLYNMTTISNHMHLILALHMGHGQLAVHSFSPGQEKHLLRLKFEERISETFKPLCPKRHRGQKVCAPNVLSNASWAVSNLLDLGGHGNSSAAFVPDLAANDSISDYRLEIWEVNRSVLDDLLHEWKGFHCRPFNNIDDDDSTDCQSELRASKLPFNLADGLSGYGTSH